MGSRAFPPVGPGMCVTRHTRECERDTPRSALLARSSCQLAR